MNSIRWVQWNFIRMMLYVGFGSNCGHDECGEIWAGPKIVVWKHMDLSRVGFLNVDN